MIKIKTVFFQGVVSKAVPALRKKFCLKADFSGLFVE